MIDLYASVTLEQSSNLNFEFFIIKNFLFKRLEPHSLSKLYLQNGFSLYFCQIQLSSN